MKLDENDRSKKSSSDPHTTTFDSKKSRMSSKKSKTLKKLNIPPADAEEKLNM